MGAILGGRRKGRGRDLNGAGVGWGGDQDRDHLGRHHEGRETLSREGTGSRSAVFRRPKREGRP